MALLETTPDCLATPRITFALEEMEQEYELRVYPVGHFESNYGMIGPAWVEDDFRLFEGNPILRHVGRAYSFGALMPSELQSQARVDGWLDFFVLRIGMSFVRGLPEKAVQYMTIVDRQLATRKWLCDSFTVADCGFITLAVLSNQLPLDKLPHLGAYLERLRARPAFQRSRQRLHRAQNESAASSGQ